ncbi:SRPBCC family protein [Nocardioides sp. dk4132]|uniref:SRPBCC family protein n=1 Tax=unclassified Nocardioides TaxID=2615069 RepID=UPI001294F766|nr:MULTISPECIES: SRPBCC family protein [unclassified Nocardioides]MQW77356.1 SRPBCC family protein [Nocardioides sp. dk4132]QGA09178.1 SRPBCC family protein [Nocardioides sp. dk884]
MRLPVAPEVAFDFLVDPRHRPAWQSSLARVEDVDGAPRVGQTWVDVTRPGLRPRMETTVLQRPHRWTERGTWRSFAAELTLTFAPAPGGCEVEPTLTLRADGPARPLAALLARLAPYAVRADLRRAARLLA